MGYKRAYGIGLSICLILSSMVLAAAPAAAATSRMLTFNGKVKVNDTYKMNLFAMRNLDTGDVSMNATMTRTQDGATQNHGFYFADLADGELAVNKTMSGGKFASATGMGNHGSAAMKWVGAGEMKSHKSECGSAKSRAGAMSGSFQFNGQDGYFDFTKNKIKGRVTKSTYDTECTPGGDGNGGGGEFPCAYGESYQAFKSGSDGSSTTISATKNEAGEVNFVGTHSPAMGTGPATVFHSIVVTGLAGNVLEINSGVTEGTLKIPAGTPFVSGTQTVTSDFTQTIDTPTCGKLTTGSGQTDGTIDLGFDSPGAVSIGSGEFGSISRPSR